jgi:integrase
MAVRKRTWKTSSGENREAWIVDYTDQSGERHIRTFPKKKEADDFHATVRVEVRSGTHTAESKSITVARAGDLWIASAEAVGLERTTIDSYRQQLRLHTVPYLGSVKLSALTAPMVRDFEDKLRAGTFPPGSTQKCEPRSAAMVKKVRGALGSILADAQERGLVARNVVRDLRAKRRRGKERRAERRQRGKLKVGVDIPTPEEIRTIVPHLPDRYRRLLLTAIFAGLRASELRGLRWADLDFGKRQLHVQQRADRYRRSASQRPSRASAPSRLASDRGQHSA